MADVTSTFCLMKLTEWTFTRALECHTSKLIKKVRWSYSCVYLCALDLAEMFSGIRIKSKCGDGGWGGGSCNLKLFHSAIFSHLTEAVFLHIEKNPKTFCPRSLLSEKNRPGSLQCSFLSGWNTILICCCRPQRRTSSHGAQVSILPWNIELIVNVDSEGCTNLTGVHISFKQLFYMCIISPWKRWSCTWSVISCFLLTTSFRCRARPRCPMFY